MTELLATQMGWFRRESVRPYELARFPRKFMRALPHFDQILSEKRGIDQAARESTKEVTRGRR